MSLFKTIAAYFKPSLGRGEVLPKLAEQFKTPKMKLSFPHVAPRERHHHFKPWSRSIPSGYMSYRCRCGAFYAFGPNGWRLTDSPSHRSCK